MMAKTILAVDDSGSLRQMVAFSLKAAGYQVIEAIDGQDGLEKARNQVVDLDGPKYAAHGRFNFDQVITQLSIISASPYSDVNY